MLTATDTLLSSTGKAHALKAITVAGRTSHLIHNSHRELWQLIGKEGGLHGSTEKGQGPVKGGFAGGEVTSKKRLKGCIEATQ